MIIYKITNLINGKSYVGQTMRLLEKRWLEHQTNKIYESLGAASRELGIFKINISHVLKRKYKQTNGYTFVYAENADVI